MKGRESGSSNARRACPYCDASFGQDRSLKRHLLGDHDKGDIESVYIEAHCGGTRPTCACGCGSELLWNGWKNGFARMIRGHNGNVYAIHDEETAKAIIEKRVQKIKGRKGWSSGLTKETSPALAQAAKTRSVTVSRQFVLGEREAWNKGLDKHTDERVKKATDNLRDAYANGSLEPWAKGLTKETDRRIAVMAHRVGVSLREPGIRQRLDAQKRLSPKEIFERLSSHAPDFELVSPIEDYTRDIHRNLKFRCKKCNALQTRSLARILSGQCVGCKTLGSKAQTELTTFVKSLGIRVVPNDRNMIAPNELDLWMPDERVAIEYNGLFYHSEAMRPSKNYHATKTASCLRDGMTLMHVFEDEWRDKRPIVESMIAHRLGKTKETIGARTCKVEEIKLADRKAFFESNHIDGYVASKVAFGLVNGKGEIVACMSLRSPVHRKHKGKLEVARFASLINTSVPGGLARLTKKAVEYAKENGYSGLMTYVDQRLGSGESYHSGGWQLAGTSDPTFWWTDNTNRFNRFRYRADKKRKMSEKEIADEAGVKKIWGCRQTRYEIPLK